MKPMSFLLLDFYPEKDLSDLVQELLTSLPVPDARSQDGRVTVHRCTCLDDNFQDHLPPIEADIIVLMLPQQLPHKHGIVRSLRKDASKVPLLVVAEEDNPHELLSLLRAGANDFIVLPVRASDICSRILRLLNLKFQDELLTRTLKEEVGLHQLIGKSPNFLAEIKKIRTVAHSNISVLIAGETGTGKELFARAIHYLSPRTHKPFLPVNCGALPVELIENELFGHERGAFTSAFVSQYGLIYEAEGGTLFLDEIDSLPLIAQVKLLRFLQEKEYRPLGSNKIRRADVRVIAATNSDLKGAVQAGKFRHDLYYRLNTFSFLLPPLRQRQEDIMLLARYFLAQYVAEHGKILIGFSLEASSRLLFYEWPGNVRELEHVVERAVLLSESGVIDAEAIVIPSLGAGPSPQSFQDAKAATIKQFEERYVRELLSIYEGNITRAAHVAGKDRRTFRQLARKHNIDITSYKLKAE